MKVVVVGPGAMGCLFAAFFTKKKQAEVWLLDKDPKRAKRIRESGITVEGTSGNFKVKVNITANLEEIRSSDLFIICVKSYDTENVIKTIEPFLKEDSNVLTLQNGLGNIEMISEVIGKERVLAGITSQGAALVSEGHVCCAGEGETIIGRIDGQYSVIMRQVRELFNHSGFAARFSKDISNIVWSKLVINVGINALTAITRLPNGSLVSSLGTREIMSLAISEAVLVAKRKKIKLVYEDPIQKTESVCQATGNNISSMLQDVLKKKKTEIDYINGAIVRQGKSLKIPCAANMILTGLVKTIEESYLIQLK